VHPTSLPDPYGIGTIGRSARSFLDFLNMSGISLWQFLPLNPPGYGESPYNAFSAFAGNPLLICLRDLCVCGDLGEDELPPEQTQGAYVDFSAVAEYRGICLQKAAHRFVTQQTGERFRSFQNFCGEENFWLDDYTLFQAIKGNHAGHAWFNWPEQLKKREPKALAEVREELQEQITVHKYLQFIFFEQLGALREKALSQGICLLGDMPIYVAHDSADVWSHPELFQLDSELSPVAVAGVPPDYFSEDGQLWGNPLYKWEAHKGTNFAWWQNRFKMAMRQTDWIRIDHFRGFSACWSVAAGEKTAKNGYWQKTPGAELFQHLGALASCDRVIAEDLGVITEDVEQLRDQFGFAGMKVLQFAFSGGNDNPYLPHNHVENSVLYTGTHDNDTLAGWWQSLSSGEKGQVAEYSELGEDRFPEALLEIAMASVCFLCILPMQDLLGLGSESRMNVPGRGEGNWSWRLPDMDLSRLAVDIKGMVERSARGGSSGGQQPPSGSHEPIPGA